MSQELTTNKAFSAVYGSTEICQLFDCGINQIDNLVKMGVIPKPMVAPKRGARRRWARAKVNERLGLPLEFHPSQM